MAEPASVFEPVDNDALDRAVRDARDEIKAGQGIPLAEVVCWLDTWGTPDELPPPSWK